MEYWKKLRSKFGHDQLILPSAAGAIIKDNNILLVFNNTFQQWTIPGGIQDLNESITDTIKREIKEELSIDVEVKQLISVYSSPEWNTHFDSGDIIQNVLFFFELSHDSDISKIVIDKTENSEWKFFPLDKLPENMAPCCREKCNDLMIFNGSTILH